jgi:hypothetical protein
MKFGAREQVMDNEEYPKYLHDKVGEMPLALLSLLIF